jgi:hypothetical protein
MPRDRLAWLPLLRHWTHCLGEGPEAIARMGDLAALPELDMAALLPNGPGWSNVQRNLRHDPEGAFRLLYYGLALRGLEALPAPAQLVAAARSLSHIDRSGQKDLTRSTPTSNSVSGRSRKTPTSACGCVRRGERCGCNQRRGCSTWRA